MSLEDADDPYEAYYLKNQENADDNCVDKEYESQMYQRSLKPEVYPTLKPIAANSNSITGKRCTEDLGNSRNKRRAHD